MKSIAFVALGMVVGIVIYHFALSTPEPTPWALPHAEVRTALADDRGESAAEPAEELQSTIPAEERRGQATDESSTEPAVTEETPVDVDAPTILEESWPQRTQDPPPPTLLPEEYKSLVAPPAGRVMRADELYASFTNEHRDESWAYTMELGIQQHIAQARNFVGTVIESVECRTNYCVIAGYVQPGYPNRSGELIGQMFQTGWWDLSRSTITSGTDSQFVTIIPRTDDDMMEFATPRSSGQGRDASTRQAESQGRAI